MKVLSWNIWVDGYMEPFKEFIKTADADVIGLQEVQDNDPERDAIGFLTQLGYDHVFAVTEHTWGDKAYRLGPALFSRLSMSNKGTFLVDEEEPRSVAYADIDVGGTTLHIFSTHLKHTHQKPSAQQEAEVARLLEKLPGERVIVMGDFNATPESAAIQAMKKVLVNTDPTSAPTWSMYPEGCEKCKPHTVDTRLDYIFVSKDLKFNTFEVGKSSASDHLPILVNVEA